MCQLSGASGGAASHEPAIHPIHPRRSIDSLGMVVQGIQDQAMDVINLKISKVGGLTKAP